MHGTEEASKLRKGESAYNPHISHKELTYLLQKSISPRSKVLLRMPLGRRLVGVNHRAPPIVTTLKDFISDLRMLGPPHHAMTNT